MLGLLCSGCATARHAPVVTAASGIAPAATAPATGRAAFASRVFNYQDWVARASDIGEQRTIFRGPTGTLDELEMHMTTLKPGMMPHAAHRHAYEEMVVLKEGTLEVTIEGKVTTVGAGSVVVVAPNELHGWKNVGTTPATYWIVTWKTPRTGAGR